MKSRDLHVCSECDEVLLNRDYVVCPECGCIFDEPDTASAEAEAAMQRAIVSARRQKLILFALTLISLGGLVVMLESGPAGRRSSGTLAGGLLDNSSANNARISSVKANMHTLQTMIETYAVDWGGMYPQTLEQIYAEARQPGREYWKDFSNPATGAKGLGLALANADAFSPGGAYSGMVLYQAVGSNPHCITSYKITGVDPDGALITDTYDSSVYTLTNGEPTDCGNTQPTRATELLADKPVTESSDPVAEPSESASAALKTPEPMDTSDVASALKSWQSIKREAFLNEDASRLTDILTGSALEETRGGLQWWTDHEARYREMQLHSLNILSQKEQGTETVAEVEISETKDNSVDGLTTTTYKATYTLEKRDGRWYISRIQME